MTEVISFDQAAGATAEVEFGVTPAMVDRFAELTGDASSLHRDAEFARRSPYGVRVIHGMLPVLFLSALKLPPGGGHRVGLRSIAGSFHKPVSAPDRLRLTATIVGLDTLHAEIEYAIAFAGTGAVVTRGQAVIDRAAPTADARPPAEGVAHGMPIDALTERVLEFDQIHRGDRGSLAFRVSKASLAAFRQIVEEGLRRPPDDGWEPANLLVTALYSTFVGMIIPGRYAIFTNFHSTFDSPIAVGQPYTLAGEIVFKSGSASTLVETVSVRDERGNLCGAGRIQARVSAPTAGAEPPRE